MKKPTKLSDLTREKTSKSIRVNEVESGKFLARPHRRESSLSTYSYEVATTQRKVFDNKKVDDGCSLLPNAKKLTELKPKVIPFPLGVPRGEMGVRNSSDLKTFNSANLISVRPDPPKFYSEKSEKELIKEQQKKTILNQAQKSKARVILESSEEESHSFMEIQKRPTPKVNLNLNLNIHSKASKLTKDILQGPSGPEKRQNTSVPAGKAPPREFEFGNCKLANTNMNMSFVDRESIPHKDHSGFDEIAKDMSDMWTYMTQGQILSKIRSTFQQNPNAKLLTKLDFYEMDKLIGRGTYGKVYLATHKLSNKPVAIKCIEKVNLKNASMVEKIFNEVQILSQLSHNNIIKLYEIFENPKYYFFVTEYVEKGDLMNILKSQGSFSEPQVFLILKDTLRALEYLHEQHILHRDVKLDNILLTPDYQAKLCDFGISVKIRPGKDLTEKCGTPAYLAPEIIMKNYNGIASDFWSIGITLFILICGVPPFSAKTVDNIELAILNQEPKFSKIANPKLRELIEGLLIKNPQQRLGAKGIKESAWYKSMERSIVDLERDKKVEGSGAVSQDRIEAMERLGIPKIAIKNTIDQNTFNHIRVMLNLCDF